MSYGDLHRKSQVARSGRVGRRVIGFPKIFVGEMPKSLQLLFREISCRFFQLPEEQFFSRLSGSLVFGDVPARMDNIRDDFVFRPRPHEISILELVDRWTQSAGKTRGNHPQFGLWHERASLSNRRVGSTLSNVFKTTFERRAD